MGSELSRSLEGMKDRIDYERKKAREDMKSLPLVKVYNCPACGKGQIIVHGTAYPYDQPRVLDEEDIENQCGCTKDGLWVLKFNWQDPGEAWAEAVKQQAEQMRDRQ